MAGGSSARTESSGRSRSIFLALGRTVLLVHDYDEAIAFYRDRLGFGVLHDSTAPGGQRFVHLGLPAQATAGPAGVGLWLLAPAGPVESALVGRQSGGQPLLVLYTADCRAAAARLSAGGVRFRRPVREEGGAVYAHIEDLYGNELVLVERLPTGGPVTSDVTVPLPTADAFRLFTEGMHRWWPAAYTWSRDGLEWIGLEPRAGGRCTERGPGGFHCDWGRVTTWTPPHDVELLWQISPRREPVPDPRQASRVRVRFGPVGGGTRLVLEHDDFVRHGPAADAYRDALAAPEGWPYILAQYEAAARHPDSPAGGT